MLQWLETILPESNGLVLPGSLLVLFAMLSTLVVMIAIILKALVTHEPPRR